MKVIRFEENDSRFVLCIPKVKEVPGNECWVEIVGLEDYSLTGVKGDIKGNKFLASQVEEDLIITVDGVKFAIDKELINPTVPEPVEVEVVTPTVSVGSVDVNAIAEREADAIKGSVVTGGNIGHSR